MIERERLTKREVVKELECCDEHSPETVKQIALNTFEIEYKDGLKAIRYHHTNVVSFLPDGRIILNSDGWLTPTTKERINNNLPSQWRLSQINSIWYIANNSHSWTFADGMTLNPDGTVEGAGIDPKELLKVDKQINKYVTGYVKALFEGKLDKPSGGDCWECYFVAEDGKTAGEIHKGKDHWFSHFEEKYYVPSLLIRAVEVFPVSQAGMHSIGYWLKLHDHKCEWFDNVARHQITSSLRRYLRRQLGLAA